MTKAFSVILITNSEVKMSECLSFLRNQGQPFELFAITENLSLNEFGRNEITLVESRSPFSGDQVYSCLSASINDYVILNYGDVETLSSQIKDCELLIEEGLVYGEAPSVDASYFNRNTFRYFFTREINPQSNEHKILPFILTRKFINYLLTMSPLIWWNSIIDPSNRDVIKFKLTTKPENYLYVKHFGFILLLLSTDVPRRYLQRTNQLFFLFSFLVSCASIFYILMDDLSAVFLLLIAIGNSLLWIVFATFFLLTALLRVLEISMISTLRHSSRSNLRFRR